eukprot:1915620-Amphidinium_carterae.1
MSVIRTCDTHGTRQQSRVHTQLNRSVFCSLKGQRNAVLMAVSGAHGSHSANCIIKYNKLDLSRHEQSHMPLMM